MVIDTDRAINSRKIVEWDCEWEVKIFEFEDEVVLAYGWEPFAFYTIPTEGAAVRKRVVARRKIKVTQ